MLGNVIHINVKTVHLKRNNEKKKNVGQLGVDRAQKHADFAYKTSLNYHTH